MNYLAELLSRLESDEWLLVEAMECTQREREVICALRAHDGYTRKEMLDHLAMSGTHFDKTCSTVLTHIYKALAPGGDIALLDLLKLKGLWNHLQHEFRKMEKRRTEKQELLSFYYEALRSLALYTYETAFADLVEYIGGRYHELEGSMASEAMVEAILVQQALHRAFSMQDSLEKRQKLVDRLGRNALSARTSQNVVVRYYQLLAEAAYQLLFISSTYALDPLEQGRELVEQHQGEFVATDYTRVLARLAETLYYADELQEAYMRYAELFASKPETIPSVHYHAAKYAQLAIAQKAFNEAEHILLRWFPPGEFTLNRRRGALGAVNFAKLYLAWNQPDRAKEFIDKGYEATRRLEIIPYEFQFRLLEALYFFARGEYVFAEELIEKLGRYARSRGVVSKVAELPVTYKMARMLIRERASGKASATPLKHMLGEHRHSTDAHFFVMLENIARGAGK